MSFPTEPNRESEGAVSAPKPAEEPRVVAFEVYGTRVSVKVPSPELIPPVIDQFPAHATPCEGKPDDPQFDLELGDDGRYAVVLNGKVLNPPQSLEGALGGLRRELFFHSVDHARDRLVVSAAVVGHEGRGILLPGPSMVGKTTLAVALVQAGAVYYADDWTLLDREGLVHPFPTRLYIKNEEKVSAEILGGITGDRPINVGLIASVTFRLGARWDPRRLTQAEGMMLLLRNAYGMDEPGFAMEAARQAATEAVVIESERDDASEAASRLLELVSEPTA
jgi:hypothetical protein